MIEGDIEFPVLVRRNGMIENLEENDEIAFKLLEKNSDKIFK